MLKSHLKCRKTELKCRLISGAFKAGVAGSSSTHGKQFSGYKYPVAFKITFTSFQPLTASHQRNNFCTAAAAIHFYITNQQQ